MRYFNILRVKIKHKYLVILLKIKKMKKHVIMKIILWGGKTSNFGGNVKNKKRPLKIKQKML